MSRMSAGLEFEEIAWLRANSPAWRLLRADSAPLVLSFLYRIFVEENVRSIPAAELVSRLDDELYARNERIPQLPQAREGQPQVGLADLVSAAPLTHGVAELITYLSLRDDALTVVYDDTRSEQVSWTGPDERDRIATLPGVTFTRAVGLVTESTP